MTVTFLDSRLGMRPLSFSGDAIWFKKEIVYVDGNSVAEWDGCEGGFWVNGSEENTTYEWMEVVA